ncbi:hypothetical protein PTKU15_93850 [Paraburkholderia terrae]|nr:hypothetical protein PTKU15_93850 [Paraburkholderia terrae]
MSDLNSRPFFPRPTVRFSRQAGVLPRVLRVLPGISNARCRRALPPCDSPFADTGRDVRLLNSSVSRRSELRPPRERSSDVAAGGQAADVAQNAWISYLPERGMQ